MADDVSSSGRPVRHGPYPEITWPAILVGYVIGSLIAISIGYLSLRLGFSIEGSELAAILGFGILRGVMRRRSVIENNINQTIASSVNGASAGMMFSIPALFILARNYPEAGYTDFNMPLMVFACMAGGVLGISFIIPLRKQMIDFDRLAYPGGIATAAIIKAPGAGVRKAILLCGAALVSAVAFFFTQWYEYENLDLGYYLGLPEYLNAIWYLSLLTIGTAYLAGRGGFWFVIGGYVCYWFLAPLMKWQGLLPSEAVLAEAEQGITSYLRFNLFRPVGIGMLIGGALTGIVLALPLMKSAISSMQAAAKTRSAVSRDELPIRFLYRGIAGAFVLLATLAIFSVQHIEPWRAVVMALLATLWIWVAGVILSECIGRTNWSPLSGMTLIGVTILIFVASWGSSLSNRDTVVVSVFVGAAMCVAMAQATDLMMDLKTGYLVGAIPRKQQIAQFMGTWLGPILVMALIVVLHKGYGLGTEQLEAPQGTALASVIQGILGGDVPMDKYLSGAGLGALLSASGIGGVGVMVGLGFYLGFNVILTYTIGTLLRIFTDRFLSRAFADDTGIPIAAGLIVGEGLIAVGFALAKAFGEG
ncbi:MAG: OPT family oligopeptide transporter [bacterium]|nr:OPT family oligopeptide transporter [bacterium]